MCLLNWENNLKLQQMLQELSSENSLKRFSMNISKIKVMDDRRCLQ